MKYCDFNGCSTKIKRGSYCDEHKRSRESIKRKQAKKSVYHNENKPFYNSSEWRNMRSIIYQREKGKCQRCGRFIFGRNAHIHHVVPIKKDPTLKLEENNLKLLCRNCHSIEENEENKEKVFPSYFKK